LPKRHGGYQNESALFREMVVGVVHPSWATLVIVSGDAAYGSKANTKIVKERDKADRDRRWGFVLAIARTWIPKPTEGNGCKTFWILARACVCVMSVWSCWS
jgi:hypothetical protein